MTAKVHDVAIIGAGPAGVAAAVYLKRAGISPLLIERGRVGGLLVNANLVENYPGLPDGISGKTFVGLLEKHLRKWGIRITKAEVMSVTRQGDIFRIESNNGEYLSRFLIIATGTRPKNIELAGMDALLGKSVFNEVAELPADVAGRRIIVIGGGDAAFDYAMNLAGRGGEVDVIFKSEKPKCLRLLLNRTKEEKRIRLFPATIPQSIRDDGGRVTLNCRKGSREVAYHGDYVLIACGREPNNDILPAQLREPPSESSEKAGTQNLFLVGDVRRGLYRQAGIAVGDGIAAAMTIIERLQKEE